MIQRALLLEPENIDALFGMSAVLVQLHRNKDALKTLARLVDFDPTNARVYAAQGGYLPSASVPSSSLQRPQIL